jgi:Pretoxin HINT domain
MRYTAHSTTTNKGTSTYTLDSRGNRLQVSGGQFDGHSKRYDADGRVREFHHNSEENRWILGTKVFTNYIFFSYDPFGNQVISVKATLEENTGDSRHHTITRHQATTLAVAGDTQVLRYQDVFYGTYCTVICVGANDKTNRLKDESFSLIDSFYQDNLYYDVSQIVSPFNVIETPTAPLEAPVEALSTTLQIDPMDVVAPSEETPTTPGESIEDVTPPADAETTTEPEATESTEGVATASTGITTLMTGEAIGAVEAGTSSPVTEEAVPIGSDLANGSPANPVVNSDASLPGATDTFAAPTSALPESLASVSTEAIAAPETTPTTGFSAPSVPTVAATTPDEVVSPDADIAPPQVGATPQDGPLDVVMPEELTANVPSVGSDVPAPIETVIPPVGWKPESDGGVDAYVDADEQCAAHANDKSCRSVTNLDEAVERERQRQAAVMEGLVRKQAEVLAQLVNILNEQGFDDVEISAEDVILILNGIITYAGNEPVIALNTLTWLNVLIDTKVMTSEHLSNFADALRGHLGEPGYVEDIVGIYLGEALASVTNSTLAAGLLSGGLDFVPYLGDAKGVIEALLGHQLGSGNSLSGFARWGGLFGLVGLAELKYGDELFDVMRVGRAFGKAGAFAERTLPEGAVGRIVGCAVGALRGANSFSPNTLVTTDKGLLAIGTLAAGSMVLAYNEETGKNEFQPVLEVFENQDPTLTYLSIEDDESGKNEMIVTTPGHPFYLEENVDNSDRPSPKGHEELAEPWLGARDLKLGDKIRQADGTTGTVKIVKTVEQQKTMYNLDVAILDNFYVGEQGWLVHNNDGCKHLVVGLEAYGLRDIARIVGGQHLMDDKQWMKTFANALADTNSKFTVAIDGLTGDNIYKQVMGAVQRTASGLNSNTDWELYQLWKSGRLETDSVTFVSGGIPQTNPFFPLPGGQ